MEHAAHQQSAVKTWVIVGLLLLWVFFKGGLAYFMIGDRGMPDWDFRPIKDVPGQSPYAIYQPLPHIQHVLNENSEAFQFQPSNNLPPAGKVE